MEYYVLLYDVYCISVPSSWIDFDRSTFRMPKKELSKACQKSLDPSNDWLERSFKKKFGPFETYSNARAVEKTVSELSTSNDENVLLSTTDNKQKRLIKKRKFYGDTSTDEGKQKGKKEKKENISAPSNYIPREKTKHLSDGQPIEKSLSFVESESRPKKMEKQISLFASFSKDCNDANLDEKGSDSSHSSPKDYCNEEYLSETDEIENTDTHVYDTTFEETTKDRSEEPLQEIDINIAQSPKNKKKCYEVRKETKKGNLIGGSQGVSEITFPPYETNVVHNHLNVCNATNEGHTSCCNACRQELFVAIATLKRKLNHVIHLLQGKGDDELHSVQENNLLPDFPLTTVQELDDFNEQLQNKNVRRQFVKKMSKVGGQTVSKTVRNIMSQTIGDELAHIYTWTGQKNKLALKKKKISDVINETVMKTKDTTNAEVEEIMQEWLRRAGDRIRSIRGSKK